MAGSVVGGGTAGAARSENSGAARRAEQAASASAIDRSPWVTRAEAEVSDRPTRSSRVSMLIGPSSGGATKWTVNERGARAGSSTAARTARSTIAARYPPLGPRCTHQARSTRAANVVSFWRVTAVSRSKRVGSEPGTGG